MANKKIDIEEMRLIRGISCRAINYMMSKSPVEDRTIFELSIKGIERAFDNQNWRGLKVVLKDIAEWAKSLSASEYQELNLLLENEFGRGLAAIKKQDSRKIDIVLKREKIVSESEYELLLNRVDEIYADPNKLEELKQLNQLLAAYHK